MRFTVPAIIMCTIGALLSIVLGVQPVLAACTDDSQCPSGFGCYDSGIPGIGVCISLACNSDHPCVNSDRPSCIEGVCRRAPASSGSGIPQSGVGQACGPRKIGQVTKNVGCKHGLQCLQGRCQKPPS
jgi:hypothetical protein